MSSGIVLGTHRDIDLVQRVLSDIGYQYHKPSCGYRHRKYNNLVAQVHQPCYFKGVDGIVSEIIFDDRDDKFPDDISREVLKKIYSQLPDMQCRDVFFGEPSQVLNVSDRFNFPNKN